MKLCFLGATHEVTGSCFLLTVGDTKVLIDCGMEQGKDIYENQPIPAKISEIDYVLVTHAHIDHSGNIPMLYKNGFRGKIFLTDATARLANVMLRDSAHIQEFEAEWRNRKAKRSGEELYQPLYTMADAIGAIGLFSPCSYDVDIKISDEIIVKFFDAGHMLGSASIKLTLTEKGEQRTIIFSGDIGNTDKPLLSNPVYPDNADYVVMESTYGDRLHGGRPDYTSEITNILRDVLARGGNLVIPSFAVGRTQELLYVFREIKQNKLLGELDFTVYVDSPLANEATDVFTSCLAKYGDNETKALIDSGIRPIDFDGLYTSITTEESKAINFDKTPKVIISASGMCEAGRIRHHLKHNLWREDSTILFVGYQTEGTLGRSLLDGAKRVKLFSEDIDVKASVKNLAGISGHADMNGLLSWVGALKNKPEKVFIVHGDDKVCEAFAKTVQEKLDYDTYAPFSGTEWDLLSNVCTNEGIAKLIVKGSIKKKKYSSHYAKLLQAGEKLMTLIRESEGYANRELEKRTNEINRIISRW